MAVAVAHGWWAIASSVLRMELDSMIRAIYLLHAPDRRQHILSSCITGKGFHDGRARISDRTMIEIAKRSNGWVERVYEFGNKFVHLTDAHDYAAVDPFQVYEHREEVLRYLNHYHRGKVRGSDLDDGATLADIAAYAPHVLDKITANLGFYLKNLRQAVTTR